MATAGDTFVPRQKPLRDGFRVQIRVIGALMMREVHTRYGRENIGYLWLILEPMLLASIIGLIHERGSRLHTADIKPLPLSLIGYCNFMTFRSIFNRAEGAIDSNLPLMYHRTVTVFDILVARAALEAAGTWISFAILIGLAVAIGFAEPPVRPLMVFTGMITMLLLSFGLSMVICGLTHDRRSLGRLVHPLSYVMMPLSGAFFPMNMLPGPIRDFFLWIPLAHVFEILRYGWFKSASPNYISPLYLGSWIAGSLLVGLLLISVVRRRIHMT